MDDFVLANLNEAQNEWSSRLVDTLCPLLMEGIRSIFNEAWKMSLESNEIEKYLMTFQNLLCRVPKWNVSIIQDECKRIIEKSGCNYLEDLITCVHVIQLKVLTCVRVGARQKKIDISVPKLHDFVHRAYINVASKVYRNAYIFDKHAAALQQQKHNREFEIIVKECILKTVRDSIPTEAIVRAYLDESVEMEEEEVISDVVEPVLTTDDLTAPTPTSEKAPEKVPETIPMPEVVPAISNMSDAPVVNRLKFDDIDHAMDEHGQVSKIEAPKSIERLEEISVARALERKRQEEDDSDDEKIVISDAIDVDLGLMNLDGTVVAEDAPITLDFETL